MTSGYTPISAERTVKKILLLKVIGTFWMGLCDKLQTGFVHRRKTQLDIKWLGMTLSVLILLRSYKHRMEKKQGNTSKYKCLGAKINAKNQAKCKAGKKISENFMRGMMAYVMYWGCKEDGENYWRYYWRTVHKKLCYFGSQWWI